MNSNSTLNAASTIDGVIVRLDEIIEWSLENRSRLGYFPALYRKVTVAVKEKIEDGNFFDDDERMARLDVIFANRYLDAFDRYRRGEKPTRSWGYAFRVADQWWPIVLQHLLLGMNAHINLDLGIAAAQTVQASQLYDLQDDFNRINQVLADLVGEVQGELAQIWRTLRFFNRYLGDVQNAVINFSMNKARDEAWSVAKRLAPLQKGERERAIQQLDSDVVDIARIVRRPGILLGLITKLVRVGEIGWVKTKIEILK